MAETNLCPKCGAPLPADAPAGLCPQCLLKQGLNAGDSGAGEPTTGYGECFAAPRPADLVHHFPQYEIVELIGQGGMGAVYKARQKQLDRMVALKILPPDVGRDPAFAERFGREARALAQLNHQNIVDVYDFGVADGVYYLTMEYVDGKNLRELIRGGNVAPKQALAIVPQICDALQFAHDEGVVHRDIKPENILVNRRGQVKIADFGLAKLLGKAPEGLTLTGTAQVMGTLHYMAPEQMQGSREVDHRADIYSLGVVFYEMLTGQLPIGRFEPPSRRVQVDVRLDEVVLRALESDPQRRYQHAGEVKTDVQSICSTTQAAESAELRAGRGRPIVRTLALVAAVLAGFAALKFFRPDLSDTIWTMVLLLSMLAFVVDLIRHRQRLEGLRAAFILLAAAVGMLGYLAAQPETILDAIYDLTGGEPGADDPMAARIIIGVVILLIVAQMFDLRKRIQAKRGRHVK
ncbi:MAG: serine/threonine-protein kinase [Pirellulales bacterium]